MNELIDGFTDYLDSEVGVYGVIIQAAIALFVAVAVDLAKSFRQRVKYKEPKSKKDKRDLYAPGQRGDGYKLKQPKPNPLSVSAFEDAKRKIDEFNKEYEANPVPEVNVQDGIGTCRVCLRSFNKLYSVQATCGACKRHRDSVTTTGPAAPWRSCRSCGMRYTSLSSQTCDICLSEEKQKPQSPQEALEAQEAADRILRRASGYRPEYTTYRRGVLGSLGSLTSAGSAQTSLGPLGSSSSRSTAGYIKSQDTLPLGESSATTTSSISQPYLVTPFSSSLTGTSNQVARYRLYNGTWV